MAKFIKLTRIGYPPVFVNVDLSTVFYPAPAAEKATGINGYINVLGSQGGDTYPVCETPEQILALIEAQERAS